MKKRLIGLLMILTMLNSLVAVPDMAKAATKSYLVLIETKEGKWTAYKDLAYASGDYLMVKGYSISKALCLTYKNNDKTLTIQNGKKKLTLTKNSKSYEYYNGSSTSKKTAAYKTYAATIAKKSTYVLHYNVLGNLVYSSYFKGSNKTTYKGYSGVICYSTVGKITSLPNIKNVVNTDGKKLNTDTTTENNNDNSNNNDKTVGYKGTVTIGKTKIPKLDGFAGGNYNNGNWGADDYKDGDDTNDYLYDAIQEYSKQLKKDVAALNDEGNAGENADIKINNDVILAQVNGDSMLSAMRLSKRDDCYEIYLATALVYTNEDKELKNADYTKVSYDILKQFCNIVTSDGKLLYDTIYKAYEVDNSGVSTTKWTTYGNFQIKARVENGHAVIFSIKSKYLKNTLRG